MTSHAAKGKLPGVRVRRTVGERIFDSANMVFLGLLALSMLYPFWYLFAISITDAKQAAISQTFLWPTHISLRSYVTVLENRYIWLGFTQSVLRTVLGTALALLLGYNLAYVLSKRYFPNRTFWTTLLVFTMFFSGGLVPDYLLVRNLKLIDRLGSLILPGAISAYNIVIMRNFLMALPDSLEESARIDGANDILILYRIILPLSMPILATVALWTAVSHWNAWFDGMIYIQTPEKQVLQMHLRRVALEGSSQIIPLSGEATTKTEMTPDTIKAATTMVATLPILCVYPFVQKYFVKGIMVGSLKG